MATVYAVASAKGGVGKTTTTAAMATILAGSDADVVAIDADIGMANLAGALGVTPGETTLHDVLAGEAGPFDAVHEGPEGLRVVPGADDLDAYASADPAGLADAVEAFADADYVFVDAGAGLSHDSSLPLAIADETLLVSTAERSALGDTEKTRQLAERLGGAVAGAAITRVDPDSDSDDAGAEGLGDVADVLDAPVLGRIPEDDAVVRAATANRPLATFAPEAPATRAYRDLTRTLTGATVEGLGIGESDETDDSEPDDADDAEQVGGDDAEQVGSDDAEPDDAEDAEQIGGDEADDDDETAEADGAEPIEDDEPDGSAETDGDEAAAGAGEGDEVEDPEATAESGDRPTDTDDENVIVADAESGGPSDPADEEETVVADEGPVPEEEGKAEPEAPDETETVGEERVDGDDLEAMIEEEPEEAEAFDDETAAGDSDLADEAASSAEEATSDPDGEEATPDAAEEATSDPDGEEATSDPDDELDGSVPFRDDDTETRSTVRSEGDGGAGETEDANGETASDGSEADDETEESGGRGFFSRLFGR